MNTKGDTEISISTVVTIILAVVAVSVILFFVFSSNNTGKEQTKQQLSVGTSAAEVADCRLWASGLYDNFKCGSVACPKDALCDACKHFGKDAADNWIVDSKNCDWANTDITSCSSC